MDHDQHFSLQPPRTSPVAFVGPSPPLSRSNSFVPHASENPTSSEKPYARAQSATTLVTPTPKKAKPDPPAPAPKTEPGYSRKKKSLGVLAENFLKTYQNLPRGSIVIVDEAAIKLGVERRRIYDVVNILESISLVCKKHKNTYTWMGMDHLDAVFGRMQAEALEEHPEDAKQFMGVTGLSHREPSPPPPKGREFKSLARLSQDFLQVFLVGHKVLSLPDASDKIQGTTSMEELVAMGQKNKKALDEKELKAAAARGLKTKIRRLYDIANVFLSVGLLEKVDSSDSTRRPNFAWAYRLSAKDLYELHRPSKKNQGESNPENDGHISENIPASTTPCRSTSASPITSYEIKAQEGDKENEWTVNEIPSAAASCEKNIKKEPMIHDAMSQPVAAIPPCSSTNSSSTFSDNHVAV